MMNFESIKGELLDGNKVSHKGWSIKVTASNHVVMQAPDGESRTARFIHLDSAVKDFIKAAGIPDKTPKPISYPKPQKGVLGPDTSTNSPWKDPAINQQYVPKGKKSDPKLGPDTSTKSPWKDPVINKRPQPAIGRGGLPNTDLGPDSSTREPKWGGKKKANSGKKVSQKVMEPDYPREAEWAVFVFDITDSVTQKPDYVSSVYEGYLVDLNSHVYIASLTPNIEGHFIDVYCTVNEKYDSEAHSEELSDFESELAQYSNEYEYFSVGEVEKYSVVQEKETIEDEESYKDEEDSWYESLRGNSGVGDAVEKLKARGVLKKTSRKKKANYEVIVGGMGSVYNGDSEIEARDIYEEYVMQSSEDFGDASGEPVVLLEDGEAIEEFGDPEIEELDQYDYDEDLGLGIEAKRNKIIDTFAEKEAGRTYQELVNSSPEARLLKDIGDPEKWAANRAIEALGQSSFRNKKPCTNCDQTAEEDKEALAPSWTWPKDSWPGKGNNVEEEDVEAGRHSEKKSSRSKAIGRRMAIQFKENWDQDGKYSRDIQAETPEELYHVVRSFGSDDDYDWSKYAPRMPEEQTLEEAGMDQGYVEARRKRSADPKAKEYWKKYFGQYGEKMTEGGSEEKGKKEKKDTKKESLRKMRSQAAPANMPPGAQMSAPSAPSGQAPAAPSDTTKPVPQAPKAPKAAPATGAGDEGVKALGWTDEDIMTMTPDQKQKIIQVKLTKPGTQGKTPVPAPVQPKSLTAPSTPAVPESAPAQAPVEKTPAPVAARIKREKIERSKIKTAFQRLVSQAMQPQTPDSLPAEPAMSLPGQEVPAAPAGKKPAQGQPGKPGTQALTPGSAEEQLFNIYQEILNQDVSASTPIEIQAKKANELMKRALSEVGMSPAEVKKLFGKENLMQLFPV